MRLFQNKPRIVTLDVITAQNGFINFAVKSIVWPGEASTNVSLFAISRGIKPVKYVLNNKKVKAINSFFTDSDENIVPERLKLMEGKSFEGAKLDGEGFVLEISEAVDLLKFDKRNNEVIKPYMSGDDLNNSPEQQPSRFAINFYDWEIDKAKTFELPFKIVLEKVKPYRDSIKRAIRKKLWWQYGERMKGLYNLIQKERTFLITAKTSKYCNFSFGKSGIEYANSICIIGERSNKIFGILQSNIHYSWLTQYGTYRDTRIVYSNTNVLQTYLFPQSLTKETEAELEKIGEEYHEFRRQLMLDMQLGLTKTYNLFHNPECNSNNIEKAKEIREFKQANLQIPLEEAIQRIEKLRELHKQMDETVLKAYGWGFDSAQPINLAHDFYEVDYLPENDRIRYTISPEARKEILKRLLELNHKIHEEEVKAGLWEKKGKKSKKKSLIVKEQGGLFGE